MKGVRGKLKGKPFQMSVKSPVQRAISIALNALESGNPDIAYNALSAVAK